MLFSDGVRLQQRCAGQSIDRDPDGEQNCKKLAVGEMADESHPAVGDNEEPVDVVSPVEEGLAARDRSRPWFDDSAEEGAKRWLISYHRSVSTQSGHGHIVSRLARPRKLSARPARYGPS